jgi:hypothetical protein
MMLPPQPLKPRRGAAHRRQHRQAAGAANEAGDEGATMSAGARWFMFWLLLATFALIIAVRWLDSGPRCYTDAQCDDLRKIERER